MADVRAMLRAERAARTSSTKPRKQAPRTSPAPLGSKKRKTEDEQLRDRKRTRPEEARNLPSSVHDAEEAAVETADDPAAKGALAGFMAVKVEESALAATVEAIPNRLPTIAPQESIGADAQTDVVNEDEWAAFQDFATSIPEKSALYALRTNAVLEAAAITAENMATQARDEQSTQRGRREEEIEEEREEAARNLEEEFEVMENLEDRVHRLREKREILRKASKTSGDGSRLVSTSVLQPKMVHEESENDGSDDADEFEGWRFGAA